MSAVHTSLRRIVLASSNRGKLAEIREVFADTGIELIAQSEPTTQRLWRLCHGTGPMLTCEVCMEFGKVGILPKRQQCDARTFRQR